MKEYEYIFAGIEEYLCDQLVSVICQENYDDKSYEHGYRRIFDEYRNLREEFIQKKERLLDPQLEEHERKELLQRCIKKRQVIQNQFVEGLAGQHKEIDVDGIRKKYLSELEKEDSQSLGKRVYIYPYIISQIGISEQRKNEV